MDKVQKIREEVERLQNELIQEKEKGFGSDTDDACILELQNVLTYIDSMQEETVSSIWHDANKEEPKKGKAFATIDSDGVMCAEYHVFEGGLTFKQIKQMDDIVKWAYVEDLIPKN